MLHSCGDKINWFGQIYWKTEFEKFQKQQRDRFEIVIGHLSQDNIHFSLAEVTVRAIDSYLDTALTLAYQLPHCFSVG